MRFTPLKWHGGKTYLAQKIIERFPPHVHYVEPYAGGLAVLFAKPAEWIDGYSEVVNDTHRELINFWQVLSHEPLFEQFARAVQGIPFSEDEWNMAIAHYERSSVSDAVAFFVRYRQSRQGLGKDFATLSRNRTRRGMNEQASAWLTAVEGLPEAHERLKRVVVLNRDALDVIRQQDGENTLFYLDPPYLHETRSTTVEYGPHEMTFEKHRDLLELLQRISGRFLLSGYPSPLYTDYAEWNGWQCDCFEIDNKSSSRKVKPKKTEMLWRNFE